MEWQLKSILLVLEHINLEHINILGLGLGLWTGLGIGGTLWLRDRTLRHAATLAQPFSQPTDPGSVHIPQPLWRTQAYQRLWYLYVGRINRLIGFLWIVNICVVVGHIILESFLDLGKISTVSLMWGICGFWPTLTLISGIYGLSYPVSQTVGELKCALPKFLAFTILPWVGRIAWVYGLFISLSTLAQILNVVWLSVVNLDSAGLSGQNTAFMAYPPTGQIGISLSALGVGFLIKQFTHWIADYILQRLPQALLKGELRDRVFHLCQRAGVDLHQLYVLPTPFIPMANAFASWSNRILLTDQLLNILNRKEVDTVIAHEIGHLRHRPTGLLLLVTLGGPLLFAAIYLRWLTDAPIVLKLLFIEVLLFSLTWGLKPLRHRIERAADRQAAKLVNDPTAMVTALTRITRFNPMSDPVNYLEQSSPTHPSLRKRTDALATQHGLPPAQIHEILAQANTPVSEQDRYPLPDGFGDHHGLWSSPEKTALRTLQQWSWILTLTLPPFLITLCFPLTEGMGRSLIHLIGLLLTGLIGWVASPFIPQLGLTYLRSRLAQKWINAGYKPQIQHSIFVTLSPDSQPYLYEDLWFWDIGFLSVEGDHLSYLGAETQFCLPRHCISSIHLGVGAPNRGRTPSLSLTWQDPHTLTIHPLRIELCESNTLRRNATLTRAWKTQLNDWIQQQSSAPSPAQLPDASAITSSSLNRSLSLRRLAGLWVWVWVTAWFLCSFTTLPDPEVAYILQVGSLGAIAAQWPELIFSHQLSHPKNC